MAFTSDADAAIKQISAEKGIPVEKVYAALRDAILVAYKKEYFKDGFNEEEDNLSVEMNSLSDGFKIIAKKTVAKKVENALREISLEQAKQVSKDLKVGDVVEVELPVDAQEFGRIAAQTAKQVLLQKNREFEKEAILEEFSGKVGQVFSALMQRMQRGSAIFEIGKASAIMPIEEQIPNEFYKVGERYKVLLKDIIDTPNGKELLVSRADSNMLIELFKMEVPEIESGVVEVKAVAREAGSRSKMAVSSNQDGVDPIGSCVGQRGIRIANVMSELGEEKIDIIEWDENIEKFVANALSPAKVESVKVKGETATVKVAEDQLSLAIGREGQNARLAWKLTTKKVDILGPEGTTRKTAEARAEELAKAVAQEKPVEKVPETFEAPTEATEEPKAETEITEAPTTEIVQEAPVEVVATEETPSETKEEIKEETKEEVKEETKEETKEEVKDEVVAQPGE